MRDDVDLCSTRRGRIRSSSLSSAGVGGPSGARRQARRAALSIDARREKKRRRPTGEMSPAMITSPVAPLRMALTTSLTPRRRALAWEAFFTSLWSFFVSFSSA